MIDGTRTYIANWDFKNVSVRDAIKDITWGMQSRRIKRMEKRNVVTVERFIHGMKGRSNRKEEEEWWIMIQYREPHVWKRKLKHFKRPFYFLFFIFHKDWVRLGKGKVEEKNCEKKDQWWPYWIWQIWWPRPVMPGFSKFQRSDVLKPCVYCSNQHSNSLK